MLNNFLKAICFCLLSSCSNPGNDGMDLSGDYYFRSDGNQSSIFSKSLFEYKTIYPKVVDYAFNEDFILVEQAPEKSDFLPLFSEGLLRRFELFSMYKKDSTLLQQNFYFKYRGFIEGDTTLYREFIQLGANENESNNRSISIRIAKRIINNDPKYINLFSGKSVYWIINHKSQNILGPFSVLQYIKKKRSLSVPSNLKLQTER